MYSNSYIDVWSEGVMHKLKYPAVIATVGGEGTRLFPLTLRQPKPLISILNYPIFSRELEILASQGCRKFIIASTGSSNATSLKDVLRFGGSLSKKLELRSPVKFMYQPNYMDNGSADSVRYCMDYYNICDDVLVVSGDNISDIRVKEVMEFHKNKDSLVTVVLKELGADEDVSQFGVADIDDDGKLNRFVEKPKAEDAPSRLINTAIYLFSPKIMKVFEEMGDRVRDIGMDVLPYLIENNYPVYGYLMSDYWADVGTPASFLNTAQDILHQKVKNIKFRKRMQYAKNRWVHPTTIKRIDDELKSGKIELGEYVFIGGDCEIGEGTRIESSSIGDNCVIGKNSEIKGSLVMDFTNIGDNVVLNGCIVGRYSTIEDKSQIDRDMPVDFGFGSDDLVPVIGENVTILAGSVIGPKKRVAHVHESYAILRTNKFNELGYDQHNFYFIEK